MIKPKPLSIGDTIGIVAPASPPKDPREIDRGIKALKALGFRVKTGRSMRKREGYLAGTDSERAADINQMFKDSNVDAILCLRGGYGSPRIVELIDYRNISRNPKIFCGFSDITALHLAIQSKTGLCTFHGPTLLSGFAKENTSQFTTSSFLKAVCDHRSKGSIEIGFPRKKYPKIVSISKGVARGRLMGGNLTLITSLIGTEYLPSFSGCILFLEDVDEPVYKVDRMITHMLQSGVLKGVRGIALGLWTGCESGKGRRKEKHISLIDMFKERFEKLKVPVVYGLPFGHINDYATLPYGVRAELNANSQSLIIQESGLVSI